MGKKKRRVHIRTPRGIRLLIIYSLILALSYLLLTLFAEVSLVFGIVVSDALARVFNALMVLFTVAVLYGLVKRIRSLYYIALVLYSASILSALVSLFTLSSLSQSNLDILRGFMYPVATITIVLNSLTLWYLVSQKAYFFDHEVHETTADRVFSYSLYTFFAGMALCLILGGIIFTVSIARTIDTLMLTINDQTITESLFYCAHKEGNEQDLCYISLVTKYDTEESITKLCEHIQSDFYRFTCYRAAD